MKIDGEIENVALPNDMNHFKYDVTLRELSRLGFNRTLPNSWHPMPAFRAFQIAAIVALSGCVESPTTSLAQNAIYAVKHDDLQKFQQQLNSQAMIEIGTEKQLQEINGALSGYSHATVGPAKVISSQQGDQGYGNQGDVSRRYELDVIGSKPKSPSETVFTLVMECSIHYVKVHHDGDPGGVCSTTIDSNNIPWTTCTDPTAPSDSIDRFKTCAISGIKDRNGNVLGNGS